MRTGVTGLPTPHPLIDQLPAVYLEQDFLRRFLAALDDVLAPVLLTIDNLPAHLDPRSAPEDFLAWLAQWVAVEQHEDSPVERRRETVRGRSRGMPGAARRAGWPMRCGWRRARSRRSPRAAERPGRPCRRPRCRAGHAPG